MLLRNLPPESATKTALRNGMSEQEIEQASEGADPSTGRWSQAEMLQALEIDALRQIAYILLQVNGVKKATLPDPISRPGVKPKKQKPARRQMTPERAERLYRLINGPDTA
ncbi:hypothetical protein AB0395_39735 [Streptosporangium sp. NPDC051023]|uniref:hypothetical protein n=1 Tax=Streptosporangium sp. NPDC051023 TaxID=3155410 RepID=UPI003450884B